MNLAFKIKYLELVRERYYRASRKQKTIILSEICQALGFSRKYAIKVLARGHMTGKKASGKTKTYSKEALFHLQKLWHVMGRMCSKKMVAAFPVWLDYYEAQGFDELIKNEILNMSSSTVDRYLKSYKTKFARRKRSGTRRSKAYENVIPIKSFDQTVIKPGYVQADTVAHCGGSMSGTFIWSVTITDEYSGWTENRAVYGKTADSVFKAIFDIHTTLPFRIQSFNSDNGCEFINGLLHEYLATANRIEFTRSRAYRKNDNCHVEQKNWTHVRELFGYDRLESEDLVSTMNLIYKDYFNLLHNFFTPQLKLIEKTRIGSKYVKKYDKPKTPYQRLMESEHLSILEKTKLRRRSEALNPIKIKKELNKMVVIFNRKKRNDIIAA